MGEPLVVIGNGMAAVRFVEELAKRALGRYALAVIGDEPRLAYNRVLLSALLAQEVGFSEIELKPVRWWRDRGVTLRYGVRATAVDPAARNVTLSNGRELPFSKLVFATGSQPIKLRIPGMDLPGVFTFRDIDDVNTIAKAGAQVTVLHLIDRLMERQLDAPAAQMLARAVEAKGIAVRLKTETLRISGSGRVETVELRDGSNIPADAVVVAVGIRANTELARAAGLKVNRGIAIDDHLETGVAGIHAIGECAEHRGLCYGLVEPAYEQAQVLARRLSGESATYRGSVPAANLKVAGVNVFSAGDFLAAMAGAEEITLSDPGLGIYKKLVIADGRLIGAVLFGDIADAPWYLELIRSGSSIERLRDDLTFGQGLAMRAAA